MTLSFGGGAGVLTIPGLTSDAANGIDVAGDVTATNVTASGRVTSAGIVSTGNVAIKGAQTGGPALLGVGTAPDVQSPYHALFYVGADGELNVEVFDADFATEAVFVQRNHPAHGPYGGPLVKFVDFSAENQPLLQLESYNAVPSLTGKFLVGKEGGIGVFGHAVQTVPGTLAQTAIDAITDANAKTAVQALANVLAAMGALTLT